MEILLLDIETAPLLADVWGMFNQNIGLNQLRDGGGLLCFAAKWLGDDEITFRSVHHDGMDKMIADAYGMITFADAIVTWNGKRFDLPHFNTEFIQAGLKPPAPYKHIDLLETAKKRFRFPSNKLQYVSTALGFKGKTSHEGHGLWVKCMDGDEEAWEKMREYNIQDVVLLEDLYWKFQPWIPNHPSRAVYTGEHVCPNCGSEHLQKRGTALTAQSEFQRYQCQKCGAWSRSTVRTQGVQIREVVS